MNVLEAAGFCLDEAGGGGAFHAVFEGAIDASDWQSREEVGAPGLAFDVLEERDDGARGDEIVGGEARAIVEDGVTIRDAGRFQESARASIRFPES